jgi:hypothetical protein
MIDVLLTNWVTYVYVAWVAVLVGGAIWSGMKKRPRRAGKGTDTDTPGRFS